MENTFIYVSQDLVYKTRVLSWELNTQHKLYLQFKSTFENSFLTDFIHLTNSYNMCQGIKTSLLQSSTTK